MARRQTIWQDAEIERIAPRVLCCQLAPRCEYHHCENPADWSAMVPFTWKPPLSVAPKFYCNPCWDAFKAAWNKPLPGIDRPAHADDEWRPSILGHIQLCSLALSFEDRDKGKSAPQPSLGISGRTPAQRAQAERHRFLMRKYR